MNAILDSLAINLNNFVTWAKSTIPEKFKEEMNALKIGGDVEAYPVEGIKNLFESLTFNEKEDFHIVNEILKNKRSKNPIIDVESMHPMGWNDKIFLGTIKVLNDNNVDYVGKKGNENILINTKQMFVTDVATMTLPPVYLERFAHIEHFDTTNISEALKTYHTNKAQVLKNVDKLKVIMITDGEVSPQEINELNNKGNKPK